MLPIAEQTVEAEEDTLVTEETAADFSGDWEAAEASGYSPFWLKYANLASLEEKNLDDLMLCDRFMLTTKLSDILSQYHYFQCYCAYSEFADTETFAETVEPGGGTIIYSPIYDKGDYILKVEYSETASKSSYEGQATLTVHTKGVHAGQPWYQEDPEKEFAIQ